MGVFAMSDYKSDYLPDAEIQDSGYYGIPALEAPPPGQDKVPGGSTPPGSLDSLKEELEWLRAWCFSRRRNLIASC